MTRTIKTPADEAMVEPEEQVAENKSGHCPNCGRLLVNIVTGSVCPGGCGGVQDRVDSEQHRAGVHAARVYNLPRAIALESVRAATTGDKQYADLRLYRVEDLLGVWRRVARKSGSILRARDGARLAVVGKQIVELVQDEAVEKELIQAIIPSGISEGGPSSSSAE